MKVDGVDQTITHVDQERGEIKPAYLFVAVLPASSLNIEMV